MGTSVYTKESALERVRFVNIRSSQLSSLTFAGRPKGSGSLQLNESICLTGLFESAERRWERARSMSRL